MTKLAHSIVPKTFAKLALSFAVLMLGGCFHLRTPEHVLVHRDAIHENLNVDVDISSASSFTGNVGGALREIEEHLAPLPDAYRRKVAGIKVVNGFFSDYLLMAPFVGAYTDSDGIIYVRNANPGRHIQTALLFPSNDVLVHELMHSVHQWELSYWRENGEPTAEFAHFIRCWELQYFGDVNGDGVIDDTDMAFIVENAEQFDLNGDGIINHKDVELANGSPYVAGRWASLQGVEVFLAMSFEGLLPRPKGYATSYARTHVWEDAAETKRHAWSAGIIPGIYSSEVGESTAAEAWESYRILKRRDPLFARKVYLVAQYLAAHEEPQLLSTAWNRYNTNAHPSTYALRIDGEKELTR